MIKRCLIAIACSTGVGYAEGHSATAREYEQQQALCMIEDATMCLEQSGYYKNVSPQVFLDQLADRIKHPYGLHQGRTFFCWAAIPLAYLYEQEPVKMSTAVMQLYKTGVFSLQTANGYLRLPASVSNRNAVGGTSFKGDKDSLHGRVVDQMVFLVFAEHYKCWMNIDRKYHAGDQLNPFWAGATLGKEERLWKDLGFSVEKRGFDLRWMKKNKATIINNALGQEKLVVLYINRASFNKTWLKLAGVTILPPLPLTASHYVLVKEIERVSSKYIVTVWDRMGWQKITISHSLFQQSVFGMTAVKQSTELKTATLNQAFLLSIIDQ